MLNGIFIVGILAAVLLAAFTGRMPALTGALFDAAGQAATLALGLVGTLALFLGLLRVAADAGLMAALARALTPVLGRLLPGVPPGHPALSAVVLNVGANLLGLGNAATPFGIKAMEELDRVNGSRGTATDAMVVFLALNTSGLAILPTTVLALRASAGSSDPASILVPTWIGGAVGATAGVLAAFLLARLPVFRRTAPPVREPEPAAETTEPAPASEAPARGTRAGGAVAAAFGLALVGAAALGAVRAAGAGGLGGFAREVLTAWLLPVLIAGVVVLGWARGVKVYESLVAGAREGFDTALRILPYLVAILALVALLRASGGLELLVGALSPLAQAVGIPGEVLPVALLRPLSGSGALGMTAAVVQQHGADSLAGRMACTIQGSTETTFYVLAVYLGAVGVTRARHAVPACLLADAMAMLAGAAAVRALLG